MKVCEHKKIAVGNDHVRCCDCWKIKTDSQDDWGIAKNKWFDTYSDATFYRTNGYVPKDTPK